MRRLRSDLRPPDRSLPRRRVQASLAVALLASACAPPERFTYPDVRQAETVDDYHGTSVPDPYRWLEALGSDETKAYIEAQNDVSEPYLDRLPAREYFFARLSSLQTAPSPGVVRRQGPFWVTRTQREGKRVFSAQTELDGPKRVVLDQKAIFGDDDVFVEFVRVSPDGRYAAFTVARGGTDRMELRVWDLEENREQGDLIPDLKFDPPQWTADSRGLVYYRYLDIGEGDGVDRNSTVFYHVLGTEPATDRVLARSDPEDLGATTMPQLSHDGRFLLIVDSFSHEQRLSVLDLGDPQSPDFDGTPVALSESRDGNTQFIGHVGGTLYLRTSRDAPNFRVVAVDLEDPLNWHTVLPESEHLLQRAYVFGGRLVTAHRHDVRSVVKVHDLDGTLLDEVSLPGLGSAFYFAGDPEHPVFTFAFDSYAHPYTRFSYDLESRTTRPLGAADTGHDPGDYVTRQIFFASRDGTRVPMFLTHREDLDRSRPAPTFLYGYGAAGAVEEPMFRDDWFSWIESGGVLAVANIRGGGEYGEAWREAGRMGRKQSSYDDFIAAAETLIGKGWASPSTLAIHGVSNGGMLIGAVMTQRPELFAAALPAVGVLDALRFPRFTAGPRWAASHGDARDPEAFAWLYRWSPLHRLADGTCYPATLVGASSNDDMVHPSQSYKFAARLQAAQGCERPTLLRVYTTGAHAYLATDLGSQADLLAFAAHHTGLEPGGTP